MTMPPKNRELDDESIRSVRTYLERAAKASIDGIMDRLRDHIGDRAWHAPFFVEVRSEVHGNGEAFLTATSTRDVHVPAKPPGILEDKGTSASTG